MSIGSTAALGLPIALKKEYSAGTALEESRESRYRVVLYDGFASSVVQPAVLISAVQDSGHCIAMGASPLVELGISTSYVPRL